jgi:hypothetical protein
LATCPTKSPGRAKKGMDSSTKHDGFQRVPVRHVFLALTGHGPTNTLLTNGRMAASALAVYVW